MYGPGIRSVRAIESEAGSPKRPASTDNETLRTIHSLRTIHGNFQDKALPEAALETILQASVRAANASNMQSYAILVVKDRKAMKEVCTYQGSCMLLALNEDWKAGGYRHYLDWFFKEWSGGSKPTDRETQMLRLLKRSGFVELQKLQAA